jgi:hypothetical protein
MCAAAQLPPRTLLYIFFPKGERERSFYGVQGRRTTSFSIRRQQGY